MRAEFAQAIAEVAAAEPRLVFLTGDLGFMALESVEAALGARFLNVGVAEQNMIGVAAGLAAQGLLPVVYSIAPFATLRPYEQIRNDVCLHKLPVKIVGNGGGYGYGIMGATHHALEDIGAMRLLSGMRVYVPLFGEDVADAVRSMLDDGSPAYLRLNLGVKAARRLESFRCWRKIAGGTAGVAITTGPVVEGLLQALAARKGPSLEVWSVGCFPFEPMPAALLESIARTRRVLTAEEHLAAGGLGEAVAAALLQQAVGPLDFRPIVARGYPSGRYGSQQWHRLENGLAGAGLLATFEDWMARDDSRTHQRAG